MKLLLINSVCGIRSTGRIVADIAKEYESKGWDVKIAYGRVAYVPNNCRKWALLLGSSIGVFIHALLVRLWGDHGFGHFRSSFATRRFLRWAEEWKPDEIWLHNLHGYYINIEMLFTWIKEHPEIEVKWTLHDCWPFTGRCGHFLYSGCKQWKSECRFCPNSYMSRNQCLNKSPLWNFRRKKRSFCGLQKMQLITPSKWLADLTRESFLKDYPVEVVHNKIDLSTFQRVETGILARYGLDDKFVILGVASTWDARKGLTDFYELARCLNDKSRIVLIGLSRSQIDTLPSNVIGIARTNDVHELVEWYSAADVFFNPTNEDNYPTVNLEAAACGCRVVTYDTGGCRETVEGYANAVVLSGGDKNVNGFLKATGLIC